MKKVALVLAGVGSLILTHGASGAIVSGSAVVQMTTAQQAGTVTYAVFAQFTSANDVLLNHTQWDVGFDGAGSFFNVDPGPAGDPIGLISNGDVPVAPGFFGLPGYAAWQFDTNLSMDNSPSSQTEPGTLLTSTSIGGGSFVTPPSPTAGADLMIQIAQITVSNGGAGLGGGAVFSGTALMVTPSATAGQGVDTTELFITNAIPGPGALALLGVAGLVSRRRRA